VINVTQTADTHTALLSPKKSFITHLGSIRLCFFLLAALIAWLFAGIWLDGSPATKDAVLQMNDRLITDWLLDPKNPDWRVTAWFLGFCILSLALFINLACCTMTTVINFTRHRNDFRHYTLLIIHVFMGLIMAGHVADMTMGYKFSRLKMLPGQSYDLPDGFSVALGKVTFAPEKDVLKMKRHDARHLLTRDKFKIKDNYIHVTVTKKGRVQAAGNVYMLSPLKHGSLRVTLKHFFVPKKTSAAPVGAILTIAKNPIHEAFFILYALMIAGMLLYTLSCSIKPEPPCY